jgi:hypothetical protein
MAVIHTLAISPNVWKTGYKLQTHSQTDARLMYIVVQAVTPQGLTKRGARKESLEITQVVT